MIMKEFKGTKGEWKYKLMYGKNRPRISVLIPIRENLNKELILGTISDDECNVKTCCCVEEHSNAELIADAGNTIQKCGDLPSELLEHRGELLDMLNRFIENNMMSVVANELATELINKINRK